MDVLRLASLRRDLLNTLDARVRVRVSSVVPWCVGREQCSVLSSLDVRRIRLDEAQHDRAGLWPHQHRALLAPSLALANPELHEPDRLPVAVRLGLDITQLQRTGFVNPNPG